MMRLKLVQPSIECKEAIQKYKEEFMENHDSMDGTSFLEKMDTIEAWIKHLKLCSNEKTVPKALVPSRTYLAVRKADHILIGMIDIRIRLNETLSFVGGHIGFSVRKSERKKGYATEMLKLALDICKELGINTVLITCKKENIASEKVILKNGGIFINEVEKGGIYYKRFCIRTI